MLAPISPFISADLFDFVINFGECAVNFFSYNSSHSLGNICVTCEFRRKYRVAELNTNSTKKYSRVSAEFELFSFESFCRKDQELQNILKLVLT